MQFERIKELVTSKDVQEILTALEKIAVLVQGCWVVKRFAITSSSFIVEACQIALFNHFSCSEINYSGRAAVCRDYLLSMFAKDRFVMRKEFSDVAMLTTEIVRDILSELSKLRVGKGWEFKLSTDIGFIRG